MVFGANVIFKFLIIFGFYKDNGCGFTLFCCNWVIPL